MLYLVLILGLVLNVMESTVVFMNRVTFLKVYLEIVWFGFLFNYFSYERLFFLNEVTVFEFFLFFYFWVVVTLLEHWAIIFLSLYFTSLFFVFSSKFFEFLDLFLSFHFAVVVFDFVHDVYVFGLFFVDVLYWGVIV